MNWYMLWQLSKIKQAEMLKNAENHRRTARRVIKPKSQSRYVVQKIDKRDRALLQKALHITNSTDPQHHGLHYYG